MTPDERADRDSYSLQRIADSLTASHQLAVQRDWRQQAEARDREIRNNEIRKEALDRLEQRAKVARSVLYTLAAGVVTAAVILSWRWMS